MLYGESKLDSYFLRCTIVIVSLVRRLILRLSGKRLAFKGYVARLRSHLPEKLGTKSFRFSQITRPTFWSRVAQFFGAMLLAVGRFIQQRSVKLSLRFIRRYSAQIGFAILVAVFLMITVGEGQAYDPSSKALSVNLAPAQDSGFFGKPQILSDQTVTTGEVQQQVAIVYQVAPGDSIVSIASRSNLSPGTILDANNIAATSANEIQPGQQLLIPAVDTNTSLDWLNAINAQEAAQAAQAQAQYQAQIAAAQKAKQKSSLSATTTPVGVTVDGVVYVGTEWGSYNGGDPGQCTWYVNSVRHFPGPMGNAGQYLSSANAYGLATGSVPQDGAVVVTDESFYGHVGIVVGVGDGTITIKEMNYLGPGKIDERTINTGAGIIKGYVY